MAPHLKTPQTPHPPHRRLLLLKSEPEKPKLWIKWKILDEKDTTICYTGNPMTPNIFENGIYDYVMENGESIKLREEDHLDLEVKTKKFTTQPSGAKRNYILHTRWNKWRSWWKKNKDRLRRRRLTAGEILANRSRRLTSAEVV